MENRDPGGPDGRELAVLDGGPADGARVRVVGRPEVLQVTQACEVDQDGAAVPAAVASLHVYRRDPRVRREPLRYGIDHASP